ncbi:hypothetical protein AXX17_AT3G36270 [Arabidopsis thaliana]|uniref:Uncharacterized protein n=1 Tax=Arabidopsis thaliana TaxID=3702 RepID=A0A178VLH6_ARATH|nr:hypothetical protein AXX17_AT3G36270 [Arabidopsis thaliana]
MNSEIERPESPSFDNAGSTNDLCTRPNDIAGPHYQSTCTLQSLNRLGELCQILVEVMMDFQMPEPTESPEEHRPGFFCVYEIYFKGCGLTFPLPEALVRYLSALEIALPQLTPNLLRTILGIITIAAEAGYAIRVLKLNELLSVGSSSKKVGYFSAYPNANRNLISHLPNKEENWHHPWFLVKKSPASIRNLLDLLPSKWTTKPAFIAPTLPTAEFGEFFKIVIEGETLWNFFTLDRFIEANHKLRMIPPGHLLQLPLPPPLPKGTSARANTARRKTMSKSIVEACEVNKSFFQSTVDKKEYSRTLLVDDGNAEGARSAGAYRPTPQRKGHSGRSSHKERSPRCDSPWPTSQTGLCSEPIADLIRKKRDRPTRRSFSPKRDKTRARTDRSPRPSSPPRSMGPPPPVTVSPSSGSGAMETEGNVFRCFKTGKDTILPAFDRWRPAICERFLLHAHHSSRAEIGGSIGQPLHRTHEVQRRAAGTVLKMSELQHKYKAVANYQDAELARSASKARKEVKGRGMELIQGAIVFIKTEKARMELESDIKKEELKAVLEEKRNRLPALPSSSFNPQQFEEFFTESPPLSESGLDWAGVSDSVEPEVPIAPAPILEAVITPPEIPPSTNSETVVIEDDDGSDSVVPSEQPATGEPDETETTAADPESVQIEPVMPENS